MHTVTRPSGVRVHLPDGVGLSGAAPPRARRFGRTDALREGEHDVLLDALEARGLTVLDEVELAPAPSMPRGVSRRSSSLPPATAARVDVPVTAGEGAVLLVDDDGMLSWTLPAVSEGIGRTARFTVDAPASVAEAAPAPRGFISDVASGRVTVYALTFAANAITGAAVTLMEGNVRRGLVAMAGTDPAAWAPVAPESVSLPSDRSPRLLVWVHGTFSTTAGSFGALCGTAPGRELLEAAGARYDAVLGLDHATLADDPIANARELRQAIEALGSARPPRIDLIAFSRGGLVGRVFLDDLRRVPRPCAIVERAIYVACANGGTALASPQHWHTLVDLYTNLAVGTFRLLTCLPQAAPAAVVLTEVVQGIGTLVKYLAAGVTTDVPGLAAMRPGCDFLAGLCGAASHTAGDAQEAAYAVTAEFRPEIDEAGHMPGELPRRLMMAVADGLVDRLMNEANDLVVNTASMTAVPGWPRTGLRDTLAFGTTPHVYHTSYFTRVELIRALARWLELPVAGT